MKGHWIVSILASILILGSLGLLDVNAQLGTIEVDPITGLKTTVSSGGSFVEPSGVVTTASVGLIYESATLGPTGQGGGTLLDSSQFLGSRFSVTETVEVTAIGGHMQLGSFPPGGSLFGAIVDMSGLLPAGSPFTGGEVVASTVFTAPSLSSDVSVPLSVILPPGDYAIIFGSGQLGAFGFGSMPSNDIDTPAGSGSYFFWNGGISIWQDSGIINTRFTVEGNVLDVAVGGTSIPLDTTALLIAGLYTNTLWLIPVIGGVAGIVIFTLKRR